MLVFIILFSYINLINAHSALGPIDPNIDCSNQPTFESFHIHILFYGTNKNQTMNAIALKEAFAKEFNVKEDCPISPGDIGYKQKSICAFDTQLEGAGPFLTAQWSFFIPKSMFDAPVKWIMQNRGEFDTLIHPNSGCTTQDHTDWSLWGGDKWHLDTNIFAENQ